MFTKCVALVAAVLALAAPTWAADNSDAQLFREISKQVVTYSQFTIFDAVHVDVEGGVVTLAGKVTMPFKKQDLERRVAGIAGVVSVRNTIDVLPVSQFDQELRVRIARAIYGHSTFQSYGSMAHPPIHIIVERGHVTLDGVVNSPVQRAVARAIASSFGAFSVTNELKTDADMREELERIGVPRRSAPTVSRT